MKRPRTVGGSSFISFPSLSLPPFLFSAWPEFQNRVPFFAFVTFFVLWKGKHVLFRLFHSFPPPLLRLHTGNRGAEGEFMIFCPISLGANTAPGIISHTLPSHNTAQHKKAWAGQSDPPSPPPPLLKRPRAHTTHAFPSNEIPPPLFIFLTLLGAGGRGEKEGSFHGQRKRQQKKTTVVVVVVPCMYKRGGNSERAPRSPLLFRKFPCASKFS